MPIEGQANLYIYPELNSKFPAKIMSALVAKNLPKQDIIVSLAQMKDWDILPKDWPRFGRNKEVKTTYLK